MIFNLIIKIIILTIPCHPIDDSVMIMITNYVISTEYLVIRTSYFPDGNINIVGNQQCHIINITNDIFSVIYYSSPADLSRTGDRDDNPSLTSFFFLEGRGSIRV